MPLLPAALLPSLLSVQQLDQVDVEGAAPLYEGLCHKHQVRCAVCGS